MCTNALENFLFIWGLVGRVHTCEVTDLLLLRYEAPLMPDLSKLLISFLSLEILENCS